MEIVFWIDGRWRRDKPKRSNNNVHKTTHPSPPQRPGVSIMMKTKFKVANINVDLINDPYDAHKEGEFHFGDTTFRQDGFSIGQDYMRFEGSTLTRGELAPYSLAIDASSLIGEGAFSQVRLDLIRMWLLVI